MLPYQEPYIIFILSSHPQVNITTFSVETLHGKGGVDAYRKFMSRLGYADYKHVNAYEPEIGLHADDTIFVKNDYLHNSEWKVVMYK